MPEQVQDFYPTPSTISTCMYYTGLDPRTMQPVYVATNPHEKAMQRALIQYRNPENYDLVHEALLKVGCEDLIGFDEKCLIRPRKLKSEKSGKPQARTQSGRTKPKYSGNSAGNSNGAKKKSTGRKPIRNVHKKKQK